MMLHRVSANAWPILLEDRSDLLIHGKFTRHCPVGMMGSIPARKQIWFRGLPEQGPREGTSTSSRTSRASGLHRGVVSGFDLIERFIGKAQKVLRRRLAQAGGGAGADGEPWRRGETVGAAEGIAE